MPPRVYDASATRSGPGWWIAPADAPALVPERMWDGLAERSDVISGRWSIANAAPAAKHAKRSRVATPAPIVANEQTEPPKVTSHLPQIDPAAEEEAVKRSSAVSAARVHIAQQISARDFVGALESLERARQDEAGGANQLRLLEAHVAIGRGDLEHAYSILLEALPDVRVTTHQHDLLAAVMVRTSRYAEAAAIYRALLAVDPANARWWAGYAVTQERLDHRTELISAYRTLRSLAPPGSALSAWANARLERIG